VTILRKRDRQIAFRVSEEEYLTLQMACLETGSRSISDLAREATKNVAAPFGPRAETPPSSLNSRVARIEDVLDLLMQEVKKIQQKLDPANSV
jgi:hypothetical protein